MDTDRLPPVLPLRRILVSTDFSNSAEQAYLYALALAEAFGAAVRLVHVVPVYEPELFGTVEEQPRSVALRRRLQARAEQQLSTEIARHLTGDVVVTPVVLRHLSVPAALLEEADTWKADLLVLGTHGRGGFKRVLLGSVAGHVVQHATTSTLVVRGQAPRRLTDLNRLLVPTDFSAHADGALRAARVLAQRAGADLELLHVTEPIPYPASVAIGAANFYEYLPGVRAQVEQELAEQRERCGSEDVPTESQALVGHPARTIVDIAADHIVDLIVMAPHGRSGLVNLLVGSVTERVVRTAACSVLVLRTGGGASDEATPVPEAAADASPS